MFAERPDLYVRYLVSVDHLHRILHVASAKREGLPKGADLPEHLEEAVEHAQQEALQVSVIIDLLAPEPIAKEVVPANLAASRAITAVVNYWDGESGYQEYEKHHKYIPQLIVAMRQDLGLPDSMEDWVALVKDQPWLVSADEEADLESDVTRPASGGASSKVFATLSAFRGWFRRAWKRLAQAVKG